MRLSEIKSYDDPADLIDFEQAIKLGDTYAIVKDMERFGLDVTVRLLNRHKSAFMKGTLEDLRDMIESCEECWSNDGHVLSAVTLTHIRHVIDNLGRIDHLVAWKELDTVVAEYEKLREKDKKR